MPKPRRFYTGSTRIISDSSITATEHRVYACVSLHDGMSLLKGKGAGCYASNQRLAAVVGCDYSTLCKALSRLVDAGYLVKGQSQDDRRMTVYRVTFPAPDEWRGRHIIPDEIGGEHANAGGEIGGERLLETGANLPKANGHYIPLKVELDTVETGEIDSVETAHLAARRLGKIEFEDNVGAKLAALERALKAGEAISFVDWYRYVGTVWEMDEHRGRATRLADELAERMSADEFEQCAAF